MKCFTPFQSYTEVLKGRGIRLGYPLFAQQNQYKGVLDSCPFGPGLSKIVELTPILSAGLTPEWDGTVLLCYFGVYYPK